MVNTERDEQIVMRRMSYPSNVVVLVSHGIVFPCYSRFVEKEKGSPCLSTCFQKGEQLFWECVDSLNCSLVFLG